MYKRLIGVLVLATVMFAGMALPAFAAEEGGSGPVQHELPKIDEVGSQSDTAQQFFPKPVEEPTVFPWFGWPLMLGAVVTTLLVLLTYLVFQPRFVSERKAKQRKK